MAQDSRSAARPAPAATGLLRALSVAQLVPIGLAGFVFFGGVQDQVARALDNHPQPLGETAAVVVVAGAALAGLVALARSPAPRAPDS